MRKYRYIAFYENGIIYFILFFIFSFISFSKANSDDFNSQLLKQSNGKAYPNTNIFQIPSKIAPNEPLKWDSLDGVRKISLNSQNVYSINYSIDGKYLFVINKHLLIDTIRKIDIETGEVSMIWVFDSSRTSYIIPSNGNIINISRKPRGRSLTYDTLIINKYDVNLNKFTDQKVISLTDDYYSDNTIESCHILSFGSKFFLSIDLRHTDYSPPRGGSNGLTLIIDIDDFEILDSLPNIWSCLDEINISPNEEFVFAHGSLNRYYKTAGDGGWTYKTYSLDTIVIYNKDRTAIPIHDTSGNVFQRDMYPNSFFHSKPQLIGTSSGSFQIIELAYDQMKAKQAFDLFSKETVCKDIALSFNDNFILFLSQPNHDSKSSSFSVHSISNGLAISKFDFDDEIVTKLALSPDSTSIAVFSDLGNIYLYDFPYLKKELIASFEADKYHCFVNKTIQFNDKSTGNPNQWIWDFGDGTTSMLANPSHSYTKAGKYTITLIATSSMNSDTLVIKEAIHVHNNLVAKISADRITGVDSLVVNFKDASLGDPISYYWDFGDNKSSTAKSYTKTYKNVGTYIVTLTIEDYFVSSDTIIITVQRSSSGSISFNKERYIGKYGNDEEGVFTQQLQDNIYFIAKTIDTHSGIFLTSYSLFDDNLVAITDKEYFGSNYGTNRPVVVDSLVYYATGKSFTINNPYLLTKERIDIDIDFNDRSKMISTRDGGFLIVTSKNADDSYVYKFSKNLELEWQNTVSGVVDYSCNPLESENNYIIITMRVNRIFLTSLSLDGSIVNLRYYSEGIRWINDAVIFKNNQFFLCGYQDYSSDYAIIRSYNSNFVLLRDFDWLNTDSIQYKTIGRINESDFIFAGKIENHPFFDYINLTDKTSERYVLKDGIGHFNHVSFSKKGEAIFTGKFNNRSFLLKTNPINGYVDLSPKETPFEYDNLLLFPNPSSGAFNVYFNSDSNQNVNLAIYSTAGNLVYLRQDLQMTKGPNLFNVDISRMSSYGYYFLSVFNQNLRETIPFIIHN